MIGEAIIEILGYIVVEILLRFLFKYPGAVILWMVKGGKKPLKLIVQDDWHVSFWISLFLWIVIVSSIIWL